MSLFWEFYQQNLIHDATDTAYRAKGIAERGRIEIEDINSHYARMVLLVTSL